MTVCIPIKVVVPTATATFATSNETFSVSQTPSLSSSKVEDIEEESSKRKEKISGNRIIDVKILLVVFLVRCYVLNVWVQFISSLWKIWEKTRTFIIGPFQKKSKQGCWGCGICRGIKEITWNLKGLLIKNEVEFPRVTKKK